MNTNYRILSLPGLYGSGASHWQTIWEQHYGFKRVNQDNWNEPQFDTWFSRLIDSIETNVTSTKVLLIAHSLGCHLAIKSLPFLKKQIGGLFLVAPPDLNKKIIQQDLSSFVTEPITNAGMPGYLIYSENDPYADPFWSNNLGLQLGIESISAGMLGHINSESNLGLWPKGKQIFDNLIARLGQLLA
jgi:predicted alpha/beta hydrolase family esterase